MIGIQREWVNEMVAEYRKRYPQDLREDWVIAEALKDMRKPRNYGRFLQDWIRDKVFEEQLNIETIARRRVGLE